MLVWVSTSSAVCKAYDVAILRAKDRIGHPIDWITQALAWRGYCTLEARIRASHETMVVP